MSTYAELAAALTPVGLSVRLPGDFDTALPCITLEPVGISIVDGARVGFEECNVVVRHPLAEGNAGQSDTANEAVYAALGVLLGSRFPVDPDIPLTGNADTTPPSFAYTITVTFAGRDICPTTPEE